MTNLSVPSLTISRSFISRHTLSPGATLDTSLLLFGCGEQMDVLMGSEITNMRLSGQLMILSACDTNVGDTLFGEGNDSLASGFLMAGSSSVIASRWRVRDYVAASLMETFYDRLSQGDTVDESLRTAKLRYIDKVDADPRNWAAFTVLGNGGMRVPIEPSESVRFVRLISGI
jgi:CHAT domain-containing protein